MDLLGSQAIASGQASRLSQSIDFSPGKLLETGNPQDLAISGEGFFVVRSGEETLYTRQGRFRRDAEGRLLTASGQALQAEGGRDLIVSGGAFEVLENGVVLVDGEAGQKLLLVDFDDRSRLAVADGEAFRAPEGEARAAGRAVVRQGAVEAANVATGDEMVTIMEAVRRAEAGQRLINVYDDLMARALTTFGQV